ncbi:MAG: hypothetical protein KKA81_13955, partial [Bacteroidetes bacterium]|nr:hypothetical protein [Bacteroidota bacterium]
IPIWVADYKGISIPVSIDYNTSGILVNQLASDIGLGWSLNAGAKITRQVRGLPDDTYKTDVDSLYKSEIGWLFKDPNVQWSSNSSNAVQEINLFSNAPLELMNMVEVPDTGFGGKTDTEPDRFFIDCYGISGSFVLGAGEDDDNGLGREILLIPYQNVKISYTLHPSNKNIESFKVIDAVGNIYYFGKKDTIRTNSKTISNYKYVSRSYIIHRETGLTSNEPSGPVAEYSTQVHEISHTDSTDRIYTTTWFIDSIKTNQNQYTYFEYEDEWMCLDSSYQKYYMIGGNNEDDTLISKVLINYMMPDAPPLLKSHRIKTISNDGIEICFKYQESPTQVPARLDVNHAGISDGSKKCKSLDKISIYRKFNGNSNHIKDVVFKYEYYEACESYVYLNDPTAMLRLVLKEIKDSIPGQDMPSIQFQYNDPSDLPSRHSYSQDFWGYHNGNTTDTTFVPTIYVYPDLTGSDRFRLFKDPGGTGDYSTQYMIPGADRTPDAQYMKDGILEKITFPSGGYVSLIYEPHEFRYFSSNDYEFEGAGLRLKQKILNDGIKNISEEYIYQTQSPCITSGKPISLPIFGYFDPPDYHPSPDSMFYKKNYIRSNGNIADMSEGLIGYETVQVLLGNNGENGKSVYHFANNATFNDTAYANTDTLFEFTPIIINKRFEEHYTANPDPPTGTLPHLNLLYNSFPFAPNTNYSWNRGYLTKMEVFDNENNRIKEIINDYSMFFKNGQSPEILYGLSNGFLTYKVNGTGYGGFKYPLFASGKYKILTQMCLILSQTIEKIYEPDCTTSYFEKTTQFKYNDFAQTNQTITTDSKGIKHISRIYYSQDYYSGDNPPSTSDTALKAIYIAGCKNINLPVESLSMIKKDEENESQILSASLNLYQVKFNNEDTLVLPYQTYIIETNEPIDSSDFALAKITPTGPFFDFEQDYVKKLQFDLFDTQ